jgi:hypothetical protein
MSGRGLLMEESCWGPQPVRGAYLVGTGSPQCGHLGRLSGAAKRRVLTLRNFCGRPILTTGAPTMNLCLHTWIGGFTGQNYDFVSQSKKSLTLSVAANMDLIFYFFSDFSYLLPSIKNTNFYRFNVLKEKKNTSKYRRVQVQGCPRR